MGDNILNPCNGDRPSLCGMISFLVQAVEEVDVKLMTLVG